MAVIFMDGFETGSFQLWDSAGGCSINSDSSMAKSGTYYAQCGYLSTFYKTLPSSKSELYFAFKMDIWDTGTASRLSLYDSDFTTIFTLMRNSTTGYLEARRGDGNGSLLATGTTQIIAYGTYLIELRYKPLNSGGVVQLKVDGKSLEIDYSGDTTNGLENVQRFAFTGVNTLLIDDVFVDDANWIGNYRIQGLVPTGAGATTQFDPSTGSNWECVNELGPSDSDYNYTNVSNEVDTFVFGNLTGTISQIKAVQVIARVRKEGNPTPTQLQLVTRPVSTDRVSSSQALATSFGAVSYIWELNPEDSAAWEEADVNGAEFGYKAVA